jgi:hypothetical protein
VSQTAIADEHGGVDRDDDGDGFQDAHGCILQVSRAGAGTAL